MAANVGWLRCLLVCVPFLTGATAVAGEPAALVDGRASYAFVRSDATDYFFLYDPAEWHLTESSSDSTSDVVRFSDGDAAAEYRAFVAPGMTPADCLQTALDGVRAASGVVDVAPLPEADALTGAVDGIAVEELAVTILDDGRREKLAVRLSCEPVEPGRSLLRRSLIVPARVYNERQRFLADYGPGILSPAQFDPAYATLVRSASGEPVVTMTGSTSCPVKDVVVLARNVSGAPLRIDPTAFAAVEEDGGAATAAPVVEWSYPDAAPSPDAPLALDPGDSAIFQVETAIVARGDLYYVTADEEAVAIAGVQRACGGGFGAPTPIDME